jgi:hypothetical protein
MDRPGVALILSSSPCPSSPSRSRPLSSFYRAGTSSKRTAFAAKNASATSLVRALVKLYEDNAATLTPDPVYSAFHDSHPPAAVRIARSKGLKASRHDRRHPRSGRDALPAGAPRLADDELGVQLAASPAGRVRASASKKTFRFADYHVRTIAFVNAVASIAHVEDHHPISACTTTIASSRGRRTVPAASR